jgi:hypothetical protein
VEGARDGEQWAAAARRIVLHRYPHARAVVRFPVAPAPPIWVASGTALLESSPLRPVHWGTRLDTNAWNRKGTSPSRPCHRRAQAPADSCPSTARPHVAWPGRLSARLTLYRFLRSQACFPLLFVVSCEPTKTQAAGGRAHRCGQTSPIACSSGLSWRCSLCRRRKVLSLKGRPAHCFGRGCVSTARVAVGVMQSSTMCCARSQQVCLCSVFPRSRLLHIHPQTDSWSPGLVQWLRGAGEFT